MSLLSFAPKWLLARWGRKAFLDHYYVPYLRELTRREHHGVVELEHRGEAIRDYGCASRADVLHWHLTKKGRLAVENYAKKIS